MDKKQISDLLNDYAPVPLEDKSRHLKALFYGDYGTRKTTLACSSGKKTLLLTGGDGGEVSLLNHPEFAPNVRVIPLQGFAHAKAILLAVAEGVEGYKEFQEGTIVIDPVGSLVDDFLMNLVDNYKGNNDRFTATPVDPKSGNAKMEAEGQGEYKLLKSQFKKLAPHINRVPANVIFIAHEHEPTWQEQAKGNFLTRPKVPASSLDIVAVNMHLIGRLEIDVKGNSTISFTNSNRQCGKSRISSLPQGVKIPTDQFWNKVEEWVSK